MGKAAEPNEGKRKKRRTVNLRRGRRSTVTGLDPADVITPIWDKVRREWRLLIESENGVRIEHAPAPMKGPKPAASGGG